MSIAEHINAITAIQAQKTSSQVRRYTIFPIKDQLSYDYYIKQEATHWTEQELDFTADYQDYTNATDTERRLINGVMAFFLVGDGAISHNLVRFLLETSSYEEQAMFISQLHIELVHAMTYNRVVSSLIRDDSEFEVFLGRTEDSPAVRAKLKFMDRWMLADHPRWQRLVAFACAEGLFFVPLFPAILYFRISGRFSNFITANELIRSDETLHCHYGCDLAVRELDALSEGLSDQDAATLLDQARRTILDVVLEAVDISCLYHDYILPASIQELTNDGLKTFTKVMADNLLVRLRCSPYFRATNTLTFMSDASLEMKSNFYERRVANYTKPLTKMRTGHQRIGPSLDYASLHEQDF